MKVIRQFRGVRIGGTVDVYEAALAVDREIAIRRITEAFAGCPWSRAYDGAYILGLSKWRELAFYLSGDGIRIEDRRSFPVQIRLRPGSDRRKIERMARSLEILTPVS